MALTEDALCVGASAAAYDNTVPLHDWLHENEFENHETVTDHVSTFAFVASRPEVTVVAFRGTDSWDDLVMDLTAKKHDFWTGPIQGRVHYGFLGALKGVQPELQKKIGQLHRAGARLLFTGHSAGGALATLLAAVTCQLKLRPDLLVTFGSPRLFNKKAAQSFDKAFPRHHRWVNSNDIVPRLPPAVPGWLFRTICHKLPLLPGGYRHCGDLHYIDVNGALQCLAPWWTRNWDATKSVWNHIGTPGLDMFSDHGCPDQYLKLVSSV